MTNLVLKFTQRPINIRYGELAIDEARNLLLKKGISAKVESAIKTPNVNTCTVIALFSKLKNKLFHLAPEIETAKNIKDKLPDEIKELQNMPDNSDVKALIIGGIEPVLRDTESEKSHSLYNAAAEVIFDDFGLDGIMLSGKKRGASMESLEIKNNEALISIKDFNPKITPLKNRYQTVEQYGDVTIDYLA